MLKDYRRASEGAVIFPLVPEVPVVPEVPGPFAVLGIAQNSVDLWERRRAWLFLVVGTDRVLSSFPSINSPPSHQRRGANMMPNGE